MLYGQMCNPGSEGCCGRRGTRADGVLQRRFAAARSFGDGSPVRAGSQIPVRHARRASKWAKAGMSFVFNGAQTEAYVTHPNWRAARVGDRSPVGSKELQSRNVICFQSSRRRGLRHAPEIGEASPTPLAPRLLQDATRRTDRPVAPTEARKVAQSRNVFCFQSSRRRGLRHAPEFRRAGKAAGRPAAWTARLPDRTSGRMTISQVKAPSSDSCVRERVQARMGIR